MRSIYRQLLTEYIEYPVKDNFNVFYEIATDMPHVETEKSMEIWYPNMFNYIEYIYMLDVKKHQRRTRSEMNLSKDIVLLDMLIGIWFTIKYVLFFVMNDGKSCSMKMVNHLVNS